MNCENSKCKQEHDGNFGSGKFCSRACANSSMKRAYKEGRDCRPTLTPEQISEMIEAGFTNGDILKS